MLWYQHIMLQCWMIWCTDTVLLFVLCNYCMTWAQGKNKTHWCKETHKNTREHIRHIATTMNNRTRTQGRTLTRGDLENMALDQTVRPHVCPDHSWSEALVKIAREKIGLGRTEIDKDIQHSMTKRLCQIVIQSFICSTIYSTSKLAQQFGT